ncbi:MAG: hypothetical protein A2W01_01425 [Candidatus Solincola sediminis]|uniref:DNA-3-methyladenine glycosylase II n=1 Tax=Candidatus Solincola sediminis TaxID=1797199 RepID=A0A1F2WHG0_9ACTN|nr:MAG: hypothetical protein A2Y75_03600 [Candidatus Solincola sediminis]OFW58777.1 MAG: hypothetical protein A2W01_01425 [Candidatus Solincola sediminis]
MKITCIGPYDFPLSWRFVTSFGGRAAEEAAISLWWAGKPTLVRIEQIDRRQPLMEIKSRPRAVQPKRFVEHMEEILNAHLALEPFYRRARKDPVLAPIVKAFRGLKPFRPPDLFQMMVTAITEQQISLAAARSIRERVVARFGAMVDDLPVFPRPADIADLSLNDLRECGLSGRKAEYIINLAGLMESGELDAEQWSALPDDELISLISSYRGFGQWTAEYILLRGLGRMDVVPAADIGIRKLIGFYFSEGKRLSEAEVRQVLEEWSPWRGLAVFYLFADYRMRKMGLDQAQ